MAAASHRPQLLILAGAALDRIADHLAALAEPVADTVAAAARAAGYLALRLNPSDPTTEFPAHRTSSLPDDERTST